MDCPCDCAVVGCTVPAPGIPAEDAGPEDVSGVEGCDVLVSPASVFSLLLLGVLLDGRGGEPAGEEEALAAAELGTGDPEPTLPLAVAMLVEPVSGCSVVEAALVAWLAPDSPGELTVPDSVAGGLCSVGAPLPSVVATDAAVNDVVKRKLDVWSCSSAVVPLRWVAVGTAPVLA